MRIHPLMNTAEIEELLKEYWETSGYVFPTNFEHRFESVSSALMYALLREYKPTSALEIGSSHGGSTCLTLHALLANKNKFTYVSSELADDLRAEAAANCVTMNGEAPIMIGDITKNLDKVPKELDFLFHDSNHDRETTDWVFKNIFPRLKKGALIIFHDWAVRENADGTWTGKDQNGRGAWGETEYMLELHRAGKFPFQKVYFNWELGSGLETGVFLK